MTEIIIEQLLEQRNSYLNILKHFEFQLILEPTKKEIENIEKLQASTIEQVKKIEQELAFLSNSKS
ncbi:MAG: hypothetical protein HKM23_06675 [Nitrosopumilus sp.]|nr:hypothetical protein [Nitrosopumilus sp.]NNL59351.1 hypothetical protein [Nitrosopumilus sp.]